MNAPTAATDTAEQWRLWAVLAFQDTEVETWNRRRALARELRARDRYKKAGRTRSER